MQPSIDSEDSISSSSGEPNLLQLKDILLEELVSILDSIRGAKALVLDKDLAGPLSSIVDFGQLQDHGVEKIHLLSATTPPALIGNKKSPGTGLIYFALPHVQKMKWVAEQIRHISSASATRECSLQLVPRRTLLCERVLEEEGVLGDLTLGEFRMDFIPLEPDLLSLELQGTFRELYLDGDFASVQYMARALMRLQGLYGAFPRIVGKGDFAAILADNLVRMRAEMMATNGNANGSGLAISSLFDSVVIIDRAVDLVTPLLTQLTYEGLISEVYGISDGYMLLPQNQQAPPEQSSANTPRRNGKRLALNSQDPIFQETRSMNFSNVGHFLSKISKQLQSSYESRHAAKTVQEIRSFVGKLGSLQAEHQSLKAHVTIAETIMRRTQSDDFTAVLDIEQSLVGGSDLSKEQMAYLEKILALGDPTLKAPGVMAIADDPAAQASAAASVAEPGPEIPNSIYKALRILCLYSLCRGIPGVFKQRVYDFWYEEVIAAFGHQHTITLDNLRQAGLFVPPNAAASVSSTATARSKVSVNSAKTAATGSNQQASLGENADGGVGGSGLLNTLVPSTQPRSPAHTNCFGYLRKSLNLVMSDVRESDPDDISYVYSGYAPLSIRLLQCLVRDPSVYSSSGSNSALMSSRYYASMLLGPLKLPGLSASLNTSKNNNGGDSTGNSVHQNHHQSSVYGGSSSAGGVKSGWNGWEDVLNEVAGETVDILQQSRPGGGSSDDLTTQDDIVRRLGEKAPATLVVFLGGCTYTEVAALRLMSQQHGHRYIAATTQIINGNTLLDPFIQHK
ncbi:Vacuolar protein-sorting-associated protein 33 [Coemansia sp. Benny D115]|nr:Vacuolar protein-sorting-associated protein 33 [Coemansia sp. Benny D115]